MNKYKITFKYDFDEYIVFRDDYDSDYYSEIVYADSLEDAKDKFRLYNVDTTIVFGERVYGDAMDAEWGDK